MAIGEHVRDINDTNFESEVLGSSNPFLLDLSAEWCGPCKAIAPVIAELAGEYNGKVGFGALDVEKCPQVAARFRVQTVPTLLMFSEGQVVGQLTGAHPKQRIKELVDQSL